MKTGELLLSLMKRKLSELEVNTDAIDFAELLFLSESHGVIPLIAEHLEENCPAPFLERVKQLTVRSLEYQNEISRIQRASEESSLNLLFFKGCSLAYTHYDSPEKRTVNDIDILVKKEDTERAHTLLTDLDYLPTELRTPQQQRSEVRFQDAREYVLEERKIVVDLHWKLFKDFYSLPFSTEKIFKNARKIPIGDVTVSSFSDLDHLLFLMAHGGKHAWDELKWIWDIKLFIVKLTEEELLTALNDAIHLGMKRQCLLGFDLASHIAGAQLPQQIEALITQDQSISLLRESVTQCLKDNRSLTVPESVRADLSMRERTSDKIKYLLKRTFIPHAEDWRVTSLPDFAFPLYYLIRPVRLSYRYLSR